MTEPRHPGELPPDLPPEYAEAYRRGYERAWGTTPAEPEAELVLDAVPEPWEGPTHRGPVEHAGRPGWLMAALLGLVVLTVLLAAYGLGRVFSSSPPESKPVARTPAATAEQPAEGLEGAAWDGDVDPLTDLRAKSSCVMPPGVDASGNQITYDARRALDGDFTTARRCAGDGRGARFTLTLDEKTRLGEVGLVPGYAKTDPRSHADRYAENNRITRVRWTFAGGRSVVQTLDGSPTNRRIQKLRIPPVETDTVTFEVLASVPGPRNTVAVSEVLVAATVG